MSAVAKAKELVEHKLGLISQLEEANTVRLGADETYRQLYADNLAAGWGAAELKELGFDELSGGRSRRRSAASKSSRRQPRPATVSERFGNTTGATDEGSHFGDHDEHQHGSDVASLGA